VVAEFPEDPEGKRILIPRAAGARDEIVAGLADRGAIVHATPVYETVLDDSRATELREALSEGRIDVVTFTSSSTVRNFFALAGNMGFPQGALAACIGPVTAQTAREHGIAPACVAATYTIEGLVDSIVQVLSSEAL